MNPYLTSRRKRALDLVLAGAGLLILAPLFFLIGVVVWLTDGRPLFFRGVRVGEGGGIFYIWKFRSMRCSIGGAKITVKGDSRITPAGAFLRRFKLDELPQLFNVLRGDMSMVGPRPEDPAYLPFYPERMRPILTVKPGITGAASLLHRDEEASLEGASPEDFYRHELLPRKLELDLEYARHSSLRSDLFLILRTVWAVLPGRFCFGRGHGAAEGKCKVHGG